MRAAILQKLGLYRWKSIQESLPLHVSFTISTISQRQNKLLFYYSVLCPLVLLDLVIILYPHLSLGMEKSLR